MERALFDDPICILLVRRFCWPGNERYRQAAALSGQQATLGFCLQCSPCLPADRMPLGAFQFRFCNEPARCCAVNVSCKTKDFKLVVPASRGAKRYRVYWRVLKHMLQYEYDVGQVMATCLLVISHILPRRASEGESFLLVPFAWWNRWCPVVLKLLLLIYLELLQKGFIGLITEYQIDWVKNEVGTCGKVLIDRPVVHLQGCIAPVPGESDQMVFAIVYQRVYLLDADVHRSDVERHTYFALFLKQTQRAQKSWSDAIKQSERRLINASDTKLCGTAVSARWIWTADSTHMYCCAVMN